MTPPASLQTPFGNAAVAAAFAAFPVEARAGSLALRELIFATASDTAGVGVLEETLKWGEPAYLTTQSGSGSTLRLGWKNAVAGGSAPRLAIYFNCKTTLVDTFRTMYPNDFGFEGNRALLIEADVPAPLDALGFCISAALTYHLDKRR